MSLLKSLGVGVSELKIIDDLLESKYKFNNGVLKAVDKRYMHPWYFNSIFCKNFIDDPYVLEDLKKIMNGYRGKRFKFVYEDHLISMVKTIHVYDMRRIPARFEFLKKYFDSNFIICSLVLVNLIGLVLIPLIMLLYCFLEK